MLAAMPPPALILASIDGHDDVIRGQSAGYGRAAFRYYHMTSDAH